MFDLTKLTEFNPALVYGFEPESSPQHLSGSRAVVTDKLFPEAGQHKDMLEAYLYAQDTILPQVKGIGISPEILLKWVKSIHSILGKTLLQCYGKTPGEYASQGMFRWHQGSPLNTLFILYFSGLSYKTPEEFATFLHKEHELDYSSALEFILLLEKIASDKNITVHDSQIPFIKFNHEAARGMIVLNKLFSAYNLDQLSITEKNIVDKIVKICMFPERIPGAMAKWANDTTAQYHNCDPANLDQVCEFLANTFFNLTEIHPFDNANGRTATCLMNIFLRSFGYPSILLRYPGDRDNRNNQYQKAIAEMASSLAPLKTLIRDRITEAQQTTFANEKRKQQIVLRVGLSDLYQVIKLKHPQVDIQSLHSQALMSPKILWAIRTMDETDASICCLTSVIEEVSKKLADLDQEKTQKSKLFLPVTLDKKQKALLLDNLIAISGCQGWKMNSKNELVAWLDHPDMKEAKKIASKLESCNFARVTVSLRVDTKTPAIKCENIDYQKLIMLANTINKAGNKAGTAPAVVAKMA